MAFQSKIFLAWIKVARPPFISIYLILGVGGIYLGYAQFGYNLILSNIILSFVTILFAVIGIHFRDEASDWESGFDLIHGGTGVIREGLLESKSLKKAGVILNLISIGFMIWHIILVPQLIYLAIPLIIILILANYLTERVILGHELVPAFALSATMIWVYLGQGWLLTKGTIIFWVFILILIFALVPYQDLGDYSADLQSGKITLTVKLGFEKLGQICISIAVLSFLILYWAILSL